MTAYARAFGRYSRGARLYLASAGVMGFTIFGGVYSLLLNLYLLRLGYGPEPIGAIHATALLGWALACLPAGAVGRLLGSRRAMTVGMAVSMVGHALLPAAELFPGRFRLVWLTGTYLLGNIAIALYDVNSQPFLTEASTPEERDSLFSAQAALWPLAGFAGSLVGGALPALCARAFRLPPDGPAAYRYPLILAAATIGVGVWAIVRARSGRGGARPHRAGPVPAADPRPAEPLPAVALGLLGLAVLLQGTGEGAARTFFTVYADASLRASTARIGFLVALGQLVAVPAALVMPWAAKRTERRLIFIRGSLGLAAGLLPLALIPHWGAAGLGYMAVTASAGLARPAVLVYLMGKTPERGRATVSGVYTMAIGLSWAAISLGGGYLIAGLGYRWLFLLSAGATACGALLFARVDLSRGADPQ